MKKYRERETDFGRGIHIHWWTITAAGRTIMLVANRGHPPLLKTWKHVRVPVNASKFKVRKKGKKERKLKLKTKKN